MKVAAVAGLAFHRWVLEPTIAALRAAGHMVETLTHEPAHPHDWLCRQPDTAPVPMALAEMRPDVVLCAEYPYGPLRQWSGAPVVTVRHSLAGRRNTWEPEQAEADWIATYGAWDAAELEARGVRPRRGCLPTGCPWAEGILSAAPAPRGEAPVILWAPTWNADLGCHDRVLRDLATLKAAGWQVVVRPHGATVWRDVPTLRRMGAVADAMDVDLGPPWPWLLAADVVVSDVSGLALCAALAPVRAALIQVDADGAEQHPQYDERGPEWRFRSQLGLRLDEGRGLAEEAQRLLDGDPFRPSRLAVGRTVAGEIDGANARLVAALEAAWSSR